MKQLPKYLLNEIPSTIQGMKIYRDYAKRSIKEMEEKTKKFHEVIAYCNDKISLKEE